MIEDIGAAPATDADTSLKSIKSKRKLRHTVYGHKSQSMCMNTNRMHVEMISDYLDTGIQGTTSEQRRTNRDQCGLASLSLIHI